MNINGYELLTELDNKNSGYSKWGFARKSGKEYFIKELLEPVYPTDRSVLTPEMFEKRTRACLAFEARFSEYYQAINRASRGNLVRIEEFFRYKSHYYVVMEKIRSAALTAQQVAQLDNLSKFVLFRSVAYAFCCLHKASIVHFDVKPDNILIQKTESGYYSVKLIDFDAGFFKGMPPEGEEIGGDPAYIAPETFLVMNGEEVVPDEKSDIFSLGLVLHEYFTGSLPVLDRDKYDYFYEMALEQGCVLPDASAMPPILADCIRSMLAADPMKRPTAQELLDLFTKIVYGNVFSVKVPEERVPSNTSAGNKWFNVAEDL